MNLYKIQPTYLKDRIRRGAFQGGVIAAMDETLAVNAVKCLVGFENGTPLTVEHIGEAGPRVSTGLIVGSWCP